MSQPHLGKVPDLSQSVTFTDLGERFRMVRASQGQLDIGVYHLEALSPGAGLLLS